MEIIIDLVARMFVKMTLAQTQGAESSIAMLVLMNVLNKNKLFTKIVIKRLAMPTMGMTTNPTTTSSTTWTRHLIVKPMLMLKTKVIKIHQGVISETILAMTKGAEDNHNMIKMRGPSLDNANNLVKIRNNIINLKFNMPKFKGEDDAEAYLSWALKVDKIFRIHNYSGAKKVAMASLEFEDYANTWWEQVVTLREEKGDPPIDTWEDMKEEMQARFVPQHYKTDLFNKLQKLKQGTKTVEEFFKEMELTMMRANIQESENQTIARFFNGLNYPIKRIVEFQQYSNMVELVHQASKAERQVNEDIKYSKSKQYFASKLATTTPTTSVKPSTSSTPSKQPTIQSRMKQTVSSTASSKASMKSERHQPHMSERKSVLLATKSEWREVKDNPSTTLHYVLICKGPSSETNDLTNIPSSLLSLLKEFQDVFPDELPHGLPPLRGIEHRIDLIPGAPLPNRAAYRTNPEDTKEIQRQIQDLLAKGYPNDNIHRHGA
ncbi:hypothetical protein QYE76_066619 [Lolium multiflorum]|uniref:Retrotransposon gag domain-containing protein n=1 Tax=Lolium multiflorum TaxID=4521 RepID=A0AAD8WC77_LOLMU|nr:hypothetical protein QYE76_066619 [Lolium multiflorum]